MSDTRRLVTYLVPYVLMTGLQYQFAKDGLRFVDPFTFMGLRYLIAGSIIFVIARSFRPILNRDMLLVCLFTFLSTVFWSVGLQYVSGAQSAVLTYTMPLFAIPLAAIMLKEKTSALGWAGALLGFVGVAVYGLALTGSGGSILGIGLTVANAFFWALYTVYYRKLANQDPLRTVGTQFFIGGLLFLPLMLFTFSVNPTPEFFVDLGYMSLVGGVGALTLWNYLVRLEKISRITTLVFAVPAASIVAQSAITGVLPTIPSVAGVCVIFAGIYVSRLRSGAPPVSAPIHEGPEIRPDVD